MSRLLQVIKSTKCFDNNSFLFIPLDNWNRIIVEIIQAQPIEFGIGFSSLRIWVNQTVTGPIYFGDFVTENLPIANGTDGTLRLCSTGSSNFDAMNFIWFQGSESLFVNASGINYIQDKIH